MGCTGGVGTNALPQATKQAMKAAAAAPPDVSDPTNDSSLPALKKLADAVHEDKKVSPLDMTAAASEVMEAATKAGTQLKDAYVALHACLPEMGNTEETDPERIGLMQFGVKMLSQLCMSVDGAEVRARGSPTADVAVLVLGMAGGSFAELATIDNFYAASFPSWRTVTTTALGDFSDATSGTGSLPALETAQMEKIAAAVMGCKRLVVHALCTHGYAMWLKTERAHPAVGEKLAGTIFDCAISDTQTGTMSASNLVASITNTVIGVALVDDSLHKRIPGGMRKARLRVEAAAKKYAERLLLESDKESSEKPSASVKETLGAWQLANERPVPTLFLTSPEDLVIPEAAVRGAAEAMQQAQPTRPVTVACLSGTHCQLITSAPKAYATAVTSLLHGALPEAAAAAVPSEADALSALLEKLSLSGLSPKVVGAITLDECIALLKDRSGDTPPKKKLLDRLQALGIEKSADRRQITNQIHGMINQS